MKKLAILRSIPFISVGLILFTKIFFPRVAKPQPGYLIFILVLVLISLLSIIMLSYNKGIKKRNAFFLTIGLVSTITIFYFQYIKS